MAVEVRRATEKDAPKIAEYAIKLFAQHRDTTRAVSPKSLRSKAQRIFTAAKPKQKRGGFNRRT
jgi:hypothetical protein